jgi:hypothetical protein
MKREKKSSWAKHRAPVCNPSYSGSRDQEDHGSRPVWARKFTRPHLNKELGMVVCACHPGYPGSINRNIPGLRWAGHKSETLYKKIPKAKRVARP